MARKSKFFKGYVAIERMTEPELANYIKKSRPYMMKKIAGLAGSKYSYFSKAVEQVQLESYRSGRYGVEPGELKGTLTFNPRTGDFDRDVVGALAILTGGSNKTLDELRRTAHLLDYIAKQEEQPARMASEYMMAGEEIRNVLENWGYEAASNKLQEILTHPKGLKTLRDFWNKYQDTVFAEFYSGEGEVDIRYYVDTYGENTEEFYLELFKNIASLYEERNS